MLPLSDQLVDFARASGVVPASLDSPELGEIDAGSVTLRYVNWGGPPTRPVVFIHGGALTARTWDLVCLALRGRYGCLAVDLRGHGESDWATDGDYKLETYTADIEKLLKRLDLDRPVLVGMSLGGQTALLVAGGDVPLRGLALIDVGPAPDPEASARIVGSISEPEEFATIDDAVRRAVVLNPRRRPETLRDSLRNNLRSLPDGGLTWKYDWRAFASLTSEVFVHRTEILWQAVDGVTCPVLVVRGSESGVLSVAAAQSLAGRLADARVVTVEKAGHTVQGDNPAGLVRDLEPFLARCFGDRGR
jgi:esterase